MTPEKVKKRSLYSSGLNGKLSGLFRKFHISRSQFTFISRLRENTESFLKLPTNTTDTSNNNNNDSEGSDSDNDQILLRTNDEAFFKYWKSEAATDRKSTPYTAIIV